MKYYVELDGISTIEVEGEINKGEVLLLDDGSEIVYYKVAGVEEDKVALRLLKYITNTQEETKNVYLYESSNLYFENRVSKNQILLLNDSLYQVLDIDKQAKELKLNKLEYKSSVALYSVYKSVDGLTIRDRDKAGYEALKTFTDRFDAIGYVMLKRSEGFKVSI